VKVDYYLPPQASLDRVLGLAQRAADLGFDGFFTAEAGHDPFLPLALAAGSGLDLGTAIAVAFPRSPTTVAHKAWDLAALSGGKFILGLGTQVKAHIVRRYGGEWFSPGPRMRDYLLALRAVFASFQNGTPLAYEGDFYRLSLMTPFFNPGPIDHPDVPLAIAGVGPYMARLAGELCQGFHIHPFHTVRYLDEVVLPNLERGAVRAGRALGEIERIATVFVVSGRSDEELSQAMESVRSQIAFYASTPSYAAVLELHGWEVGGQLAALSRRGQWGEMPALVSDEMVHEVAVVAPLEDLGAAIRRRYGPRLQRVGYYLFEPGWPDEVWRDLITATRG
jgi:probable F420-dependent oxidoreductase